MKVLGEDGVRWAKHELENPGETEASAAYLRGYRDACKAHVKLVEALKYAAAILSESAKQHRAAGDGTGHGEACMRAYDKTKTALELNS